MKRVQIYLKVPASDALLAQEAGAKWDALLKRWYVPKGVDLERFRRWWPARMMAAPPAAAKTSSGKGRPRSASREQDAT